MNGLPIKSDRPCVPSARPPIGTDHAQELLPARFWAKVRVAPSGCWEWIAARGTGGYGLFRVGAHLECAHRFAYKAIVGPITRELTIDHLCRNHSCVNPAHLEAVTMKVNILRGDCPGAKQARQAHCIHGHTFDLFNTYYYPKTGKRKCQQCNRLNVRRYRSKER